MRRRSVLHCRPHHPVVVEAVRTVIGKYRGALAAVRADELAALPLQWLYNRYLANSGQPVASPLDSGQASTRAPVGCEAPLLVVGCANQAGEDGRNLARMAGLLAGLPVNISALTVNRLCGSGLDSVTLAAMSLAMGEAEVALAGGVEQMSRAPLACLPPHILPEAPLENTVFGPRFTHPAFPAAYRTSMAEAAEQLAVQSGITRQQQDAFALQSHQLAWAAQQAGHLNGWRLAVGNVTDDEPLRPQLQKEHLARLAPVVAGGHCITAGNSTGFNDGAAAVLLLSPAWARAHGYRHGMQWVGSQAVAAHPNAFAQATVQATQQLLQRAGLSLAQVDCLECHEAFAVSSLAILHGLGLDPRDERLNAWGGSLAVGAPMGMTGTRLVAQLFHRLQANPHAEWGLVLLSVGLGQGLAALFQRISL